MKKIKLLGQLEGYPLFTGNDIAKILNKPAEYVRTLLYRLNKEDLIKRIEKGKYTVHEDGLIFGTYIAAPSYFSLWTAFRYYNMTQQQPMSLFVMSNVKRKKIMFQNAEILFFFTKQVFGYKKMRYADFDIFMAEPEKAIIDALLFKLPLPEIMEAMDRVKLDGKKIAAYAKKTKNISLMKRLGYLLEIKKGSPYGLSALDNNYIPLDYLSRKTGKKEKKWKLMINI